MNSNKPVIGIVGKPNLFSPPLWKYMNISDSFRYALVTNGAVAMGIIPTNKTLVFNREDDFDQTKLTDEELNDLHQVIDLCDGIILAGGLSSASYEIEIAKHAIKNDIPLLGVCAGFNNIIRAAGGDVFELKEDHIHNQEDKKYVHSNKILKDTLLFDIVEKEEIEVNSIHSWFAKGDGIKNLEISAYSFDGYVEAVELKTNKFLLGVKWHPELLIEDELMENIIKRFIDACKKI